MKIDSKPAVVIEKEVIQPEVIEKEVLGPQEGDPIDIECEDGTIITCPLGSPGCEDYSELLCVAPVAYKVIHCDADGSHVECEADSPDCVDNSGKYCPPLILYEQIRCPDGSILECEAGDPLCTAE